MSPASAPAPDAAKARQLAMTDADVLRSLPVYQRPFLKLNAGAVVCAPSDLPAESAWFVTEWKAFAPEADEAAKKMSRHGYRSIRL